MRLIDADALNDMINLPQLTPTEYCEKHETWIESNTSGFARGKGGSRGMAKNARERSKTFDGIADAMAEQWGALENGEIYGLSR